MPLSAHYTVLTAAALLAACLLTLGPAAAEDELKGGPLDIRMDGHEPDTYRFGYPYKSSRGTTPGECEIQCNRDTSCSAWSLVPATFRMGPRCELKRNIGTAEHRPGAVSGIASKYHPRAQQAPSVARPDAVSAPPPSYKPAPPPSYKPAPPRTPRPADIKQYQNAVQRPVAVRSEPTPPPEPAPRPASLPVLDAVTRPGPPPPTRAVPQFEMRPTPAPASPATSTDTSAVQIYPPPPPIQPRKPWTERSEDDLTYSVEDMDFIPGDEEATAGYLDGAPDN